MKPFDMELVDIRIQKDKESCADILEWGNMENKYLIMQMNGLVPNRTTSVGGKQNLRLPGKSLHKLSALIGRVGYCYPAIFLVNFHVCSHNEEIDFN
jgi:hypothetical protein